MATRLSALAAVLIFAGCGEDEKVKAPAQNPRSVRVSGEYLHDEEMKARLDTLKAEQLSLTRARSAIEREMARVVAAHDGDKVAAATDPEMASLIARAKDLEKKFAENREAMMVAMRASVDRHTVKISDQKEVTK